MVSRALQNIARTLPSPEKAGTIVVKREHADFLLICAYTLCVAMEAWTSNGINVILIDIAGSIGASADETSWITTVYSAAAAVSILTAHNLCKVIGERLYILSAALLFGVASAGCALSMDLAALLTFRVLQGLAGGAFMTRTLVLLMTHFHPEKRSTPLKAYLLILFVIGRFAAPLAAGYLNDLFSWRNLFWLNVVASLLAAWIFCVAPNRKKPSRKTKHSFDFLGSALLITGISALQLVMNRGEIDDWLGSALIRTALLVGIFAHIAFVAWEISPANRYPLVHLRALLRRDLLSVTILGVLLGALFSAILYIFPFYLRQTEIFSAQHSATQTGLLLSIVGVPMIALALIAPRFVTMVQKLGGRTILTAGLLLQILSSTLLIATLTSDTPDLYLAPVLALSGAFIFFTAVGLAVAGFAQIPVRRISNARTLYFGARQMGNSLGISLALILLDRREAFHSQRLSEAHFLRNRWLLSSIPNLSSQSSMQSFGKSVLQQATILSYRDLFVAIIIVALVTMAATFLLPRNRKTATIQDTRNDRPELPSVPVPQGTN